MPQGGTLTIETCERRARRARRVDAPGLDTGGVRTIDASADTGTGMTPGDANENLRAILHHEGTRAGNRAGPRGGLRDRACSSAATSESRANPGKARCFKVYLPETQQAVKPLAAPDAVVSTAGTETILLVEDEDAVRAFMKTVLERFGYRVLETSDAEEALFLLATVTDPIDLLLTDVILPKMDGRELALRVTRAHPSARVLFMSGTPSEWRPSKGCSIPGCICWKSHSARSRCSAGYDRNSVKASVSCPRRAKGI